MVALIIFVQKSEYKKLCSREGDELLKSGLAAYFLGVFFGWLFAHFLGLKFGSFFSKSGLGPVFCSKMKVFSAKSYLKRRIWALFSGSWFLTWLGLLVYARATRFAVHLIGG